MSWHCLAAQRPSLVCPASQSLAGLVTYLSLEKVGRRKSISATHSWTLSSHLRDSERELSRDWNNRNFCVAGEKASPDDRITIMLIPIKAE